MRTCMVYVGVMDHLLHIENTDDGNIDNADGTNDGDD